MVLRRFKTTTIFDFDSETGRSKIVSHYTTQIGEGVKMVKKQDKPLVSETAEQVEM